MSIDADSKTTDSEKLDTAESILLELRVISTILGESQNINVDELRESIQDDN